MLQNFNKWIKGSRDNFRIKRNFNLNSSHKYYNTFIDTSHLYVKILTRCKPYQHMLTRRKGALSLSFVYKEYLSKYLICSISMTERVNQKILKQLIQIYAILM